MPSRPSSARLPARAAGIGALLLLAGCHYASSPLVGFGGFVGDTHTFRTNPNIVPGHDENTLYSEGRSVALTPLLPEGGNVWPGPPPPVPTLGDVEKQQNQPPLSFEQPGTQAPAPLPIPHHGSSTPPGPQPPLKAPAPGTPPAQFRTPGPTGPSSPPVINTPSGPLINNGPVGAPGGPSTATNPEGGTDIVVPNGNGTSTVISPDGSTRIIPTPR